MQEECCWVDRWVHDFLHVEYLLLDLPDLNSQWLQIFCKYCKYFPFLPKLHFQFPFPFLLSLSPFPPLPFPSSSFPFLFLSLSFSVRPFVCAKKRIFAFIPINIVNICTNYLANLLSDCSEIIPQNSEKCISAHRNFQNFPGEHAPDPLEGARASPSRDRYVITNFGGLRIPRPPVTQILDPPLFMTL